MNLFQGDEMGANTLLPLVTIIPALIGSGLISAGFIIHPLFTINPKERGLTSKDISIWQVTVGNETKSWQKYIGSPSPMPIEIGAATFITALILSGSSFFKLRPSTKLVSAHGLLLASFFSLAGLISMTAGFNVHYDVEQQYPYWLVVAGTVILFIGGIIGHLGRQMEKSSYRFSVSNIIFYILSIGSAALLAACTGMETFGDSSQYCTIFQLGLCEPFAPMTKLGLFQICEGDQSDLTNWPNCWSWDETNIQMTQSFQWAINFVFAMFIIGAFMMIMALIVKFVWNSLRGFAATLVVMGLGCAICGQCVISVLLASYYHRYDEDEYWNELRYGSQYYGDAYYIALAGLVLSAITLASLLGEESQTVNYMSPKKSAVYDSQHYGMTNVDAKGEKPRAKDRKSVV